MCHDVTGQYSWSTIVTCTASTFILKGKRFNSAPMKKWSASDSNKLVCFRFHVSEEISMVAKMDCFYSGPKQRPRCVIFVVAVSPVDDSHILDAVLGQTSTTGQSLFIVVWFGALTGNRSCVHSRGTATTHGKFTEIPPIRWHMDNKISLMVDVLLQIFLFIVLKQLQTVWTYDWCKVIVGLF